MDYEIVKSNLEQFLYLKSGVKETVKRFVQDKNYPLEQRWKIFIDSDLGGHDNFYHEFDGVDWDNFTFCDDIYVEKYQTVTVIDLLGLLHDKITNEEENEDGISFIFDEAAFKEYFLREFLKSFKYDW